MTANIAGRVDSNIIPLIDDSGTLSIGTVRSFMEPQANLKDILAVSSYKTVLDYSKILYFWAAINNYFVFDTTNVPIPPGIPQIYRYISMVNNEAAARAGDSIQNNMYYNNFFVGGDIVAMDKAAILIPSSIVIEGSDVTNEFRDIGAYFFLRGYQLKLLIQNRNITLPNPPNPPINDLFQNITNKNVNIPDTRAINRGGFGKNYNFKIKQINRDIKYLSK